METPCIFFYYRLELCIIRYELVLETVEERGKAGGKYYRKVDAYLMPDLNYIRYFMSYIGNYTSLFLKSSEIMVTAASMPP